MSRDRVLVVALLFTGCFLLTAVIGFTYSPRSTPTPPPTLTPVVVTPAPTPTRPLGEQTSLLLVGVESLAVTPRRLQALWVIAYLPGIDVYYLVGYAPDITVRLPGDNANHTLAEICAGEPWDRRGSPLLAQAVQTLSPGLTVEAQVLFDRAVLIEAINRLGGVAVDEALLNGSAALASVESLPVDDHAARLLQQGDILRSLLARDWSTADVRPLFSLGQQWFPSQDWFLAQAGRSSSLAQAEFRITTFPAAP